MSLTKRKKYTVNTLMADLKKTDPTPSVLYKIGAELIYTEVTVCNNQFGSDHVLSTNMNDLLEFMQDDYERMLVEAELRTTSDTPSAAITRFLKERPKEFLSYTLSRPADYIHALLKTAIDMRKKEKKKYKQIEKGIRKNIKDSPENPALWNQLRLILWIQGKHKDAAEAYKTATKFGWTQESSKVVAVF
ncbi:MAG: hypothetical protein RTU30_09925 [Candidatus Thorarchaeota archaeon]